MLLVFLNSVSSMMRVSPPPLVLQLRKNEPGLYPPLDESIMYWGLSHSLLKAVGCSSRLTHHGHVVLTAPLSSTFECESTPLEWLQARLNFRKELVLTDCTTVFTSDMTSFKCFLSGMPSCTGIAARIEGTGVWLLISNYMGIVTCNECKSTVDIHEWRDIQNEIVNALRED